MLDTKRKRVLEGERAILAWVLDELDPGPSHMVSQVRNWSRLGCLAAFVLSACPVVAQYEHGSVGIVYFTPNKIAMAADSRFSKPDGSVASDAACKIVALNGQILFVSTNMTHFNGGPRVAGWDNAEILREVYQRLKAASSGNPIQLERLAVEWTFEITSHFNELARLEPDVFGKMVLDVGNSPFTFAYMGGFEADVSRLFMMSVMRNPTLIPPVVPNAGPVLSCQHHDFCALVDSEKDRDVFFEFADLTSDRAKKDASHSKPNATLPLDRDAYRTKHMAELIMRYQSGNSIGGPVHVSLLRRNGVIERFPKNDTCPAN